MPHSGYGRKGRISARQRASIVRVLTRAIGDVDNIGPSQILTEMNRCCHLLVAIEVDCSVCVCLSVWQTG
jgi:hypothetical protein